MPNLTPSRGPTLDAATYSTGCWGRYNAAWGGGLHSHLHNAACACTTPPAASQLHNAAKLDAKLDCGGGLLPHLHNAACGVLSHLHIAVCGGGGLVPSCTTPPAAAASSSSCTLRRLPPAAQCRLRRPPPAVQRHLRRPPPPPSAHRRIMRRRNATLEN